MTRPLRRAAMSLVAAAGMNGLACHATLAEAPSEAQRIEEARGVIAGFAKSLLAELQGALKTGGPVAAIDVCNKAAPAIAANAARESGWKVGRTALKIRNPANQPDAFERRVLESFLTKAAEGADLAKLEHREVVVDGGVRTLRYMKAIAVAEPCLTCHGGQVNPDVKAAIAARYPNDQATGFKPGDLRGAFTMSRVLE